VGSAAFQTKPTTRFSWSSTCITPKALRFGQRHVDAGHAEVGLALDVFGQHAHVIHLVYVVAGKHQHVLGPVAADQVEVLEHRIGRAAVPVFADLLLRRQDVDELVEAAVEEAPAALQVLDQALCLVLGGDADAADAGIDAVRQREVDDAEFAAETAPPAWSASP
jgi:hypothetical protein